MIETQRRMTPREYVAHFGAVLLNTERIERSVRARLFKVLVDCVAAHVADIRTALSVRNAIRETSPFTRDEREFRATVTLVIASLAESPAVAEISATLYRLACEARTERIFDRVTEAMSRQVARQSLLNSVGDLLRDQEALDLKRHQIHRELARI